MNIIIVGCGKVGRSLAQKLSNEGNNVTIIDQKQAALDKAAEASDVMCIRGNGLSVKVLTEAGIEAGDIIMCVATDDETNMLCCLTANLLGVKYTVARVRDPDYAVELSDFKEKVGINMIINPEHLAALEISRLLRFPTAHDIDTFVEGKVELVSFRVSVDDNFCNKQVMKMFHNIHIPILLATVERDGDVFIPHGDTVLVANDLVRALGRPSDVYRFLNNMGKHNAKIRNALIIGGSRTTYYLAHILHAMAIKGKIIEIDEDHCTRLSEQLPDSLIINADGTDEETLQSENIDDMDSLVCLTDRDEQNAIVALYALQRKVPKVIAKINRINLELIKSLGVESVISPINLTANHIIRYVRGLKNSVGNNIRMLYKIGDNENAQAEALEFLVDHSSRCVNMPIKKLALKKDILIGCIVRGNKILIPDGDTQIHNMDTVIVITQNANIEDFDDILKY